MGGGSVVGFRFVRLGFERRFAWGGYFVDLKGGGFVVFRGEVRVVFLGDCASSLGVVN